MLAVMQRAPAATEGEGGFWATTYPIIPHPGEIIMGLLAFAVVYWVYRSKVVPTLEEVYHKRHEAIEGGMARAEKAEAEVAQLRKERDWLANVLAELHDTSLMLVDGAPEGSNRPPYWKEAARKAVDTGGGA